MTVPPSTTEGTARRALTPPSVSRAARLLDVIVDPRTAFRGLDASPTWVPAFFAVVALRFGSLFAFYRPDASVPKLVAGVLFQVLAIGPAVAVLALVLWGVAKLWGAHLPWVTALSVTVHVFFAYTLATVFIASAAGALLPATTDVDLRDPPFTNLAFLVSEGGSGFVERSLAAADIRMAYAFVLTHLGVSAVRSQDAVGASNRAGRVVVTTIALYVGVTIATAVGR